MTVPPEAMGPMRDGWRSAPSPSRLDPGHPLYTEVLTAHEAALAAGDALYRDPITGNWAMTADTLAARGCCETGCRHCPWAG